MKGFYLIKKYMLIISILSSSLFSFEQIVVVIADNLDSNRATLQSYELHEDTYHKYADSFEVNLGTNGLAWRKNPFIVIKDALYKKEGDLKSPAGIFKLSTVYGYAPSIQTAMDYTPSSENLICIDDTSSHHYNSIQKIDSALNISSFEWMKREDKLYKYAIFVEHNSDKVDGDGSCIFMHIQKAISASTAGCTSMHETQLKELIMWLDKKKQPLLVQIPKSKCLKYERIFNGIDCS